MHIHRLEKVFLGLGVATLAAFFAILVALQFGEGLKPPSHIQTIDPAKVSSTPPFDHPGLRRRADGSYEAYYVAQVFSWQPASLTVPRGAKVTFYVTSTDVVHGFLVEHTDVNLEVMPGWVSSATHVFTKPGDYLLVCDQYCGAGHASMFAHILVK